MTVRRRRRAPSTPIALDKVIEPAVTGPKPEAKAEPIDGDTVDSGKPKPSELIAPRRRRASVGGFALKLSAPAKEGHKRRFVNDDGNRIAQMKELGYEFASETGIKTADPGSHVTRLVGTKANGEPLHAHLMETPDELYAEGVAEKEAANRQIDEAIAAGRDSTGRLENSYGHGSVKVER